MKKLIIFSIFFLFSCMAIAQQEPPIPIDKPIFIILEKTYSMSSDSWSENNLGSYQPRLFLSIEDLQNYSKNLSKDSILPYLIIGNIAYKLEWMGEVPITTIKVIDSYQDWQIKPLE